MYAILGTHLSYLGCLFRTVSSFCLLFDVTKREEGVVALHPGRAISRYALIGPRAQGGLARMKEGNVVFNDAYG